MHRLPATVLRLRGLCRLSRLPISSLVVAAVAAVAAASLTPTGLAQERGALPLHRVLTAPASLLEFLPQDQWIPGTRKISRIARFRRTEVRALTAGGKDDAVLFTAAQFNKAFAAAGVKIPRPGIIAANFTWHDENTLRVRQKGGVYYWKLGSDKAELVLPIPAGADPVAIAKDDSRLAFVKDHQLYVQIGKAAAKKVTEDGSADITYGGPAHRSEFGIHDGLWWAPGGRFLAFFREDLHPITPYPYVDHTVMPPKSVHGRYPMAGRANSFVQVGVYDSDKGQVRYLDANREKDVYWTNTTFEPGGRQIYVALVNRAQDHMDMLRFDAEMGVCEGVFFSEKDEQWIEPEKGPQFLPDQTSRFLWVSPRDGYKNLYLYDAEGKLQKQLTRCKFDVHDVIGYSADHKRAYFMGSGSNPLEMHLWEIDIESGKQRQITKDRGWHDCSLSPDGQFVTDSFSNLENPGQSQIIEIATGKVSNVKRIGHRFPVIGKQDFFQVKADDGTTLHGMTILPPGLDPKAKKKYPVLLYVYGGPHSQLVKDRWLGGASLWLHYMATQGVIVCTLDNRGTDNRGIEFSQSVFRRLGDLEVKDQLEAIKYLCSRPYVDAKRIGVHGWSYGGNMTLNLMLRSPAGTIACGASGAPVTDWRQYETGYTERYMDTPKENPRGYAKASVIARAKKLKGRLLILHGTDDKTVMWSHSLRFVDRCIEAGVLVDYMPYPMQKHGIAGRDRLHLFKLLTRFFREQLRPGI